MEYWDDTAAIYPSSTSVEEGRLPEAPMEIALSEDILKYLGFECGIGDKITLSLQKNLRHNIADVYKRQAVKQTKRLKQISDAAFQRQDIWESVIDIVQNIKY